MKKTCLAVILICAALQPYCQKFTISGTVTSAKSGETIIGATIRSVESHVGIVSNEYGFYSLTLPAGSYHIEASAIGLLQMSFSVGLYHDTTVNILLEDEVKTLQGVTVTTSSSGGRSLASSQMGVEHITTKEINNIPVLFGEKDVLKTIQLLPGIKSAGDGNSGFYVRGGALDQNLILLDEAPVYNASHLLGFFSTFNSDAIKDVTVYKGGMPAQYGGRLSSVVDVKMNEGNNKDYHVSGGIGLISTKLNIEGPIQEDKSSFLITARRTYADLFLKLSKDSTVNQDKLYFYDLNAKLNYILGKKNRLYISGYFGRDVLGAAQTFGLDWGNGTGTMRWNHIFNSRLFANTSLIFSNYNYKISVKSGADNFDIFSQIRDLNFKEEFQWYPNSRNSVRFGVNSIYHTI
ncbi:MAG TPA: TonB-dependent receptor, partial [Chitinophagaceae bacterium]|nr:TonB-dependent receptor [Chitinophagaceae bacterium]